MRSAIVRSVFAAALVCAAAVASQAQTTATSTETKTFEVLAVDGNQLVVRLPEGTRELTVADDFRFTVDGQQLGVRQLKTGMRGTATITTRTTVTPVTVTEVKNGTVAMQTGSSIIVRTDEGLRSFTQGDIDKRGVKIIRGGKPAQVSDFRQGDRLSATIITSMPPRVVTEQEVQETLAKAAPAGSAGAPTFDCGGQLGAGRRRERQRERRRGTDAAEDGQPVAAARLCQRAFACDGTRIDPQAPPELTMTSGPRSPSGRGLVASDFSGALHGVIAVDQLDPEALGLGVDHQGVSRGEPVERVAARLLVEVRAGDVDRGVAAGERLRDQLADDALAQAGQQHEVPRTQQAQRVAQLGAVLVAEIGDDDDRARACVGGAAAPAPRPRSRNGSASAGRRRARPSAR